MLNCPVLPASVSSCLHPFELSDLLLCLCMHTSTFSSFLRYASLFFSSSVLQLLHIMLLHACITHNNNPHVFYVLRIYTICAPSSSSMRNASACSSQCHGSAHRVVHCHSTFPPSCSLKHLSDFLHSASPSHVESSGDHHGNSSSFLAVTPMRSSSLGVMLRFLSFTGSPDSSSSLASVNRLYDQSSLHWQMPRDSSSPLEVTLQLLEFSGSPDSSS
jgi:hypothetical protein